MIGLRPHPEAVTLYGTNAWLYYGTIGGWPEPLMAQPLIREQQGKSGCLGPPTEAPQQSHTPSPAGGMRAKAHFDKPAFRGGRSGNRRSPHRGNGDRKDR